MNRTWSLRAAGALVIGVALTLSGCAGSGSAPAASHQPSHDVAAVHATRGSSPTATTSTSSRPKPKKKHYPSGPPMEVSSIVPTTGTTVGLAMPISIVFTDPVSPSARKGIEQALTVTTSTPVVGAWHWFSDRRVDFRPESFWKSGTRVSLTAAFNHVGDGNGRYGTHSYTRTFTIGADVRTHVYVKRHRTVVTRDGKVIRTMLSDAGNPVWPTWDGTMAVVEKSPTIRMTSCSVGISCKKGSSDYYDLTLPWDVRLTWSGTFVHYSTGDPYPGHSYGSHGCVHLSYQDAEWFYRLSKPGDPVTITGSPRGKADGDNGYAGYDLTWSQWLAGSVTKQFTTHA